MDAVGRAVQRGDGAGHRGDRRDAAGEGELLIDARLYFEVEGDIDADELAPVVSDDLDNPVPAFRVSGLKGVRGGEAPGGLSPREREVLALVVDGLSNRAIAEQLVISEFTAIRHVSNIFAKLRVGTRAAATKVALTDGLLDGG